MRDGSDGVGKTGRDHPDTSYVAARSPLKLTQQEELLGLVADAGELGITCFEAAKAMDMAPNQVATRMMELREQKKVWRTRRKRPTTPGNSGYVHVLMRYRVREIPRRNYGP